MTEAAEILQEIIKNKGELSLNPLLFRAQLLCSGGSSKEALKLLSAIEDENVKYMGAMVATKVALMEQVLRFCCLRFGKSCAKGDGLCGVLSIAG